jgi:hypothetical protein
LIIKEGIQETGYFKLSFYNEEFFGTLNIFNGGEIKLELIINDFKKSHEIFGKEIDIIIGKVGFIGQKRITLIGGFVTSSDPNTSKVVIHPNTAYSGEVLYDNQDEITFNKVSFSIEGFYEWVGITGINSKRADDKYILEHVKQNSITFNLNNRMKFKIIPAILSVGRNRDLHEAKFIEDTLIEIESKDELEFSEFRKIIYSITYFMCFVLNKIVSIYNLKGTSNNVFYKQNNQKIYPRIDIYYSSLPFSSQENKNFHYKLFEFCDIRDNCENMLNIWIDLYHNNPALSLYFLYKNKNNSFWESKFLALSQALETFHRRTNNDTYMNKTLFKEISDDIVNLVNKQYEQKEWIENKLKYANEITLRQRIKSLIKPFDELLENKQQKRLINFIVDTRNYLTHYDEELKHKAALEINAYHLCQITEIFFKLIILNKLGLTKEQIDNIINNNKRVWNFQPSIKLLQSNKRNNK